MNQTLARKIFLTMLLLTAVGCGSKETSVQGGTGVTPDAQRSGGEQQVIRLGQPVIQLEMNHLEKEPIFETREVPATCTRIVQRGTHPECHTEYDQVCSTRYEQQCRSVQFPVCTTQSENVCRNVPDQVCHTETRPVCQTVQKCETVNDQVCHGTGANRVCTTVPRRVCHAEQSCHNESRRVCETITRRECHIETRQQCHNETRQECTNVPRQHCESVPRQACVQVPTTVQEPYPCTKPQQVQVGERVKLHELAQVRVNLVNPRGLDVTKDDLIMTLINGRVTAVTRGSTGIQYIIRETSLQIRQISATEVLITATLEVTAI